jgi:hypothetical protein
MGLMWLLLLLEMEKMGLECEMTILELFDTSFDASPERRKLNGWQLVLSWHSVRWGVSPCVTLWSKHSIGPVSMLISWWKRSEFHSFQPRASTCTFARRQVTWKDRRTSASHCMRSPAVPTHSAWCWSTSKCRISASSRPELTLFSFSRAEMKLIELALPVAWVYLLKHTQWWLALDVLAIGGCDSDSEMFNFRK